MIVPNLASLYLEYVTGNVFLLLIALFSLYLTLTGRRALAWRGLYQGTYVNTQIDLALAATTGAVALAMAGLGLAQVEGWGLAVNQIGYVLLIFGAILGLQVWGDYRTLVLRQGITPHFWQRIHIFKMIGASIAAYTAFFVVNNGRHPYMPPLLGWLGPTAIGTPIIIYLRARIRRREGDVRYQSQMLDVRRHLTLSSNI